MQLFQKQPKQVLDNVPVKNQPYIIFGDGLEAVIFDMREAQRDGKWYWQIMIIPTQALIEHYNIKSSTYFQGRSYIHWEVEREFCWQINVTPHKIRWITAMKFNNEINPIWFEKGLVNQQLLESNARMVDEIISLKAGLARAEEEKRMMRMHPDADQEAIREEVKKILLVSHAINEAEAHEMPVNRP